MSETVFNPTPWSAVMQAAGDDPERARRAFERLCATYRDAITHWMRLQLLSREDAEDAAHDFLEQWLQRENPLKNYKRGEQPFRGFLRVCLRNFLNDWEERRRAKRRGGGAEHVPWEHDDVISDGADSHACLDFAFATQIHAAVLASLKDQRRDNLATTKFDRLQAVALGAAPHPGDAALAVEMGVKVGTLKSWIYRLRRGYHDAFREAVSRQADPEVIDHDVIHLHRLLLHPPET